MMDQVAWRVEVTDDCVASTQCIASAPDLFVLNDEGYSTPANLQVSLDRTEDLRDAVEACPSGAIRMFEKFPDQA